MGGFMVRSFEDSTVQMKGKDYEVETSQLLAIQRFGSICRE